MATPPAPCAYVIVSLPSKAEDFMKEPLRLFFKPLLMPLAWVALAGFLYASPDLVIAQTPAGTFDAQCSASPYIKPMAPAREEVEGVLPYYLVTHPTANGGAGSFLRKKTDVINPHYSFFEAPIPSTQNIYSPHQYNSFCYWVGNLFNDMVKRNRYEITTADFSSTEFYTWDEGKQRLNRAYETCQNNTACKQNITLKINDLNLQVNGDFGRLLELMGKYLGNENISKGFATSIYGHTHCWQKSEEKPGVEIPVDPGACLEEYVKFKNCDKVSELKTDIIDDAVNLGCNTVELVKYMSEMMCDPKKGDCKACTGDKADYPGRPYCPTGKLIPGISANDVRRLSLSCADYSIKALRKYPPAFDTSILVKNYPEIFQYGGWEVAAQEKCQLMTGFDEGKYRTEMNLKAGSWPVGYCPVEKPERDAFDASGALNITENSTERLTAVKAGNAYVERILEPEPSSLSVHSYKYDVENDKKDYYPERDITKMNEPGAAVKGTLCQPERVKPGSPPGSLLYFEEAETRWNIRKNDLSDDGQAGKIFANSKMYPQTDHSDAFSPRHQEAKYEWDNNSKPGAWLLFDGTACKDNIQALPPPQQYVFQHWYPVCFRCNGNTFFPERWDSALRAKNPITPMQWNHKNYKRCVDCIRYCQFSKYKEKVRNCDTPSSGGTPPAGCPIEYEWKCRRQSITPPEPFGSASPFKGYWGVTSGCCSGNSTDLCAESKMKADGVTGDDYVPKVCPVLDYSETKPWGMERMRYPDKACLCPPGANMKATNDTEACENDVAPTCDASAKSQKFKFDDCNQCETLNAAECCETLDTEYYPENFLKRTDFNQSWNDLAYNGGKVIGVKPEGVIPTGESIFRPPHGGPFMRIRITRTGNIPNNFDQRLRMIAPVPEGFWALEESADTWHQGISVLYQDPPMAGTPDTQFGGAPGDTWDEAEMCVDQGDYAPFYAPFRMPFAKRFDGDMKMSCNGYNDAIIGVGDAHQNCGYGGWEELKLYQQRCYRIFGFSCLCNYEKTFKLGSAEEYVLRKSGIIPPASLVGGALPGNAAVGITRQTHKAWREWPHPWRGYVSEPDGEYRFPAVGAKEFYGVPSTNKNALKVMVQQKILEYGLSKVRAGDIVIWDRDVLWSRKDFTGGIAPEECDATTLLCGNLAFDLLGVHQQEYDERSRSHGEKRRHERFEMKYSRLPHVAFVTDAYTEAALKKIIEENDKICGSGASTPPPAARNIVSCTSWPTRRTAFDADLKKLQSGQREEYIVVSEMNFGKNPDTCGNTDKWGIESTRYIYKNKEPDWLKGKAPFDLVQAEFSCAEPNLKYCVEPQKMWDRVKVFHVQDEDKYLAPLATPYKR